MTIPPNYRIATDADIEYANSASDEPIQIGSAGILNAWGTPRELINADEFCPDCEREVPFHYTNCPTRKGN